MATSHTASATSAAAMGWMSTGARCTVSPSVAASAMRSTNSKNCVARRMVYGIGDSSINFSCATFAR